MIGAALLLATAGTTPAAPPQTDEARTAALFDKVAGNGPALRVFLRGMPKGGDLHNHLWGAIYAEDFLRWAADDDLCVVPARSTLAPGPCAAPDTVPARGLGQRDPALYGRMVDAFSTRWHEAGVGDDAITGHERFFSTFGRFAAIGVRAMPRMLAAARAEAAADHLAYVELMQNPSQAGEAGRLAASLPWNSTDLAANLRGIEAELPRLVTAARAEMDRAEAEARRIGGCDDASPAPACAVTVRYIATVDRSQPPATAFGQMALGFALAEADPRFPGITILAPEDLPVAVADYRLHMQMFRFLHSRYPKAKLTLHAGELVQGLVPPADLSFHISDAIETAGARRIGHGVAIAHEKDAPALLARMAREKIAVEINLTSNAVILGVKGRDHPLALYRAAGVPVVLSTDDQGVSRSDMTNEYFRAAIEQGLRYADLKKMARDSLEYSFLPGASLWTGNGRVPVCATMTEACRAYLGKNEKAAIQWRLEQDFTAFEREILKSKL
ncbi:adenosine deaminase family protein [Sphingomonas oleivorans]|nr:adenosine deaminase [Sphingomonas oleivorans]